MSRSQENQTFNTEADQQKGYNANEQTSYNTAQTDVGDYQDQLNKTAAANPYTQGGEMQTTENQQLSNSADAGATSTGEALQSAAVRTGSNAGGDIAATTDAAQANERNVSGQEAAATQARVGNEASYNQAVLGASAVPESMEAGLASQQGNLATGAGNTAQQAAQTPSFTDELGNAGLQAATGLVTGNGTGSKALYGCWIAEAIYGEFDPRTMVARLWLNGPFLEKRFGPMVMRFYLRFGQRIAWVVARSRFLRWALKPLFDVAVQCGHNAFGMDEDVYRG
jgi:hypothetical protein